jgi:hypothetical protein
LNNGYKANGIRTPTGAVLQLAECPVGAHHAPPEVIGNPFAGLILSIHNLDNATFRINGYQTRFKMRAELDFLALFDRDFSS